jgi:hypothetical protein
METSKERKLFPETELFIFVFVVFCLWCTVYGLILLFTWLVPAVIYWVPIGHAALWPGWGIGVATAYLGSVVVRALAS